MAIQCPPILYWVRSCLAGEHRTGPSIRGKLVSSKVTTFVGSRRVFRARPFAQRLVPVDSAARLDGVNPGKIKRILRHVEFAHRRAAELVFR